MMDLTKSPAQLKASILQDAMMGKLTQQLPEDGDAKDLLTKINAEKDALINAKKIKKQKALPEIEDDEIPFEIPDNWQWVRLGEIGYITSGGTPKRNIDEYWNSSEIPWLTPKFLGQNQDKVILNDADQYISETGLNKSSAQLIQKGSIVYSSRAPIGHINIVNFDYTTNQGAKSVTTLSVYTKFIYYALKQQTKNISKRGSGTTFKEISGTKFGESIIPLPPLLEQKHIVEKLDSLLPKVDNFSHSVEKLHNLREELPSRLSGSFLQSAMMGKLTKQLPEDGDASELLDQIKVEKETLVKTKKIKAQKTLPEITADEIPFEIPDNWQWVRFSFLYEMIGGSQPPKSKFIENNEDGYVRLYQTRDYGKKPMPIFIPLKTAKKTTKKGEILVARYGASLGKVFVAENGAYNVALAKVSSKFKNNNIENKFLWYYLKSNLYQSFIKSLSKSAQAGFNKGDLIKLLFPIPPLSEQKRIIDKLDKLLDKLKN